jgi:hypothetical protein
LKTLPELFEVYPGATHRAGQGIEDTKGLKGVPTTKSVRGLQAHSHALVATRL